MQDHTPYYPDNITEYAPWVAKHGLLQPYGKCQCGCKKDVAIAKRSDGKHLWRKGHPRRFLPGHYQQENDIARAFWKYCVPLGKNDCWQWQGNIGTNGYGRGSCGGKTFAAHRVSYELHRGSIPDGMMVLHKCDNPTCINPDHLFLGTDADNMQDKIEKGRANFLVGERVYNARLTSGQVIEIRRLSKQGISQSRIARQFGVSTSAIGSIVSRKNWKHI